MRRIAAVLLIAVLWAAAGAAARTPDEAAGAVADRGYYLGPGTDISEGAVSDLVREAADLGARLMIVVLDEEPPGGAATFATAVLDRVGAGTVFVLTEDGFVGYDTVEFDRSRVEAALDEADARGGSDLEYLSTFVGALTGAQPSQGADGGGGAGGLLILLLIVAGLVAVVVFVVRRQSKTSQRRVERDLSAARAEIQAQLDAMANDILDLADKVVGNDEARSYYEQGSAAYAEASEMLEKAQGLAELEQLSDRLDEAAWQLDAAEALLEGAPVPAKPEKESARCFFDPTHRGPMEDAEIRTSAGTKTVRVCRSDAEKLRRGDRPDPRLIEVGGKRVPAAGAPRSHGGLGMGGLDLFSILVGGMASGLPQRWGRRRGRGMFDRSSYRTPLPGPSRRRSTTARSAPRSRTRSRGGRRRGR